VAEWLNAAVSKTVIPSRVSRVRISPSPPNYALGYNESGVDMWYVYILKSKSSKFRYIGSTVNLRRRLVEHNTGESPSTKAYRPYEIEAYIAVQTEELAKTLEHYFKTGSGKAVLNKRILGILKAE
jgi:putative endonuclease